MAEAQITKEEVPVTVVAEVTRVNLSLTMAEARTLLSLLSVVGGEPEKSPRKYCASIHRALVEAKVRGLDPDGADNEVFGTRLNQNTSIYFNEKGMSYIYSHEEK